MGCCENYFGRGFLGRAARIRLDQYGTPKMAAYARSSALNSLAWARLALVSRPWIVLASAHRWRPCLVIGPVLRAP